MLMPTFAKLTIFLGHKKQRFDSPANSTVGRTLFSSTQSCAEEKKTDFFHLKAALVKPDAALGLV